MQYSFQIDEQTIHVALSEKNGLVPDENLSQLAADQDANPIDLQALHDLFPHNIQLRTLQVSDATYDGDVSLLKPGEQELQTLQNMVNLSHLLRVEISTPLPVKIMAALLEGLKSRLGADQKRFVWNFASQEKVNLQTIARILQEPDVAEEPYWSDEMKLFKGLRENLVMARNAGVSIMICGARLGDLLKMSTTEVTQADVEALHRFALPGSAAHTYAQVSAVVGAASVAMDRAALLINFTPDSKSAECAGNLPGKQPSPHDHRTRLASGAKPRRRYSLAGVQNEGENVDHNIGSETNHGGHQPKIQKH